MVFESQEIMSYNKDDSLEQYLTTSGGKTYNCFVFFFGGGGGGWGANLGQMGENWVQN